MSWNEPRYSRSEQHPPEDIALLQSSKQPQHAITQEQASSTGRTRSPLTLLREWKWELATWLLGSCAFGTIVTLLVIYQNRSLRDWTLPVRPAPAVAALSQATQSALLFSVSACIGQLKWYAYYKIDVKVNTYLLGINLQGLAPHYTLNLRPEQVRRSVSRAER
jgi:hypothetical protein